MSTLPLTARQTQVLDYIQRHMAEHGAPPTRVEIAAALGFKSANAAEEHLQALARKGAIQLISGASRGIRLKNHSDTMFTQPTAANEQGDWLQSLTGMLPGFEQMHLPLVGRVAAGNPILAQQHVDEIRSLPVSLFDRKPHFLLRVKGMSMRDAGILDGDLLAVRSQTVAQNGQIVIARIEDEVTVKRYFRESQGAIRLKAENPEFQDILVPPGTEFQIEGVMVGLIRSSS